MKQVLATGLLIFTSLLTCSGIQAAPHLDRKSSVALDKQLAVTLDSLSHGNVREARVLARQTARDFPDSALAQLLSAELNTSAAHQNVKAASKEPFSQQLQALLDEAQVRMQHSLADKQTPAENLLPSEVIQLGNAISALLVIDLEESSLHHLGVGNGAATLIGQHYVGSGKGGFGKQYEGDNKTPLGVYTITGLRSDESLPDLYGAGALTLNYPNALDQALGRTGSGIWLHGVPHAQRSRAPRSSEGCVTMSNDHFQTLQYRLSNEMVVGKFATQSPLPTNSPHEHAPSGGAIVLLTHRVKWQDPAVNRDQQAQFQQLFSRYQRIWRGSNKFEYFSLYASNNLARESFRRIASQRKSILPLLSTVKSQDITILRNPTTNTDDPPQVVMQLQFGRQNEYQLTLFWQQQSNDNWKIMAEQWATLSS